MSKIPASDTIMPTDKLKPLLVKSKEEPVSAAIALTSDGEAVLLLDRKVKPRKTLSLLKAAAAKGKVQLNTATLRFGRAEVDTEYDAAMVRFFVSKDAPGNMRAKLVEVVKRMSFQKVEINVDPSLEDEPEEDGVAGIAGGVQAPPPAPPPSLAPAPPPPPPADDAMLKRTLAELIARIPKAAGDDGQRKATMMKIAGIANDQLKAAKGEPAVQTMRKLRDVLDAAPPGTDVKGGGVDLARWEKAWADWEAANDAVSVQITKLQARLRSETDEELQRIAEFGLNAVTGGHKVALTTVRLGLDGEASAQTVAEAKVVVEDFLEHVQTDGRVAACDENPFKVKVTVRATLAPALQGLAAALTP